MTDAEFARVVEGARCFVAGDILCLIRYATELRAKQERPAYRPVMPSHETLRLVRLAVPPTEVPDHA